MKTVAFIGFPSSIALNRLKEIQKDYRFVVCTDHVRLSPILQKKAAFFDEVYTINSKTAIQDVIGKIGGDLCAVTARTDGSIPLFARVIPYLPDHVRTPDPDALLQSVQKIHMRRAFAEYDPSVTPAFAQVREDDDIDKILKNLSFPLMVKPSGLSASKLVQCASTPHELFQCLNTIFHMLSDVYDEKGGCGTPEVLIEEYIDGEVYSTDVYVDTEGQCMFCPLVGYVNESPGHQSFAPHIRFSPVALQESDVIEAERVARIGIDALGLRNITAHVELIQSKDGWKLVEIGPRTGGNRDKIYSYGYGFNHTANDLYVRIPGCTPRVLNKVQAHVVVVFLYPEHEGTVISVNGFDEIKQLESYRSGWQSVSKGDTVRFVEHGGSYGAKVTFVGSSREQVDEDITKAQELFVVGVD